MNKRPCYTKAMSVLRNLYLMIGFWGIVLCFVVQLLISTVLYLFKQDDKPVSFVATRFLLKIILGILGVKLKVHNEDLVPKDQGFILCANHASMLDIAVIILAVKCPIFFIAKREFTFRADVADSWGRPIVVFATGTVVTLCCTCDVDRMALFAVLARLKPFSVPKLSRRTIKTL